MFVTHNKSHQVSEYTPTGTLLATWGGFGSLPGQLDQPWGIDVDDATGHLYVTDTGNARVQVFEQDGTFVRAFGSRGEGPGQFRGVAGGPVGIAFEQGQRVVWVADAPGDRVLKFDEFGTVLLSLDGSTGAGPHPFRWPRSVDVDADGNAYVVETDAERIQVLDADGAFLGQFQGPHSVEDGPFHPRDIAVSLASGAKYVNAAYAARVDVFDAANDYQSSWGGRLKDGEYLLQPRGLAVSPVTGDVYFFDAMNTLLKGLTAGGAWIHQWGGSRRVDRGQPGLWGSFGQSALAADPDGNVWAGVVGLHYPDDPPLPFVQQFDGSGRHLLSFLNPQNDEFTFGTRDLAVVPSTRDVLVTDLRFDKVIKYRSDGVALWALDGLAEPGGVAATDTHFFVVESAANQLRKYDLQRNLLAQWGAPGSGPGEFDFESASGVAIDPNGHVYVADSGNARIQRFDAAGGFLDELAPGQSVDTPGTFWAPVGVGLSPGGEILYVSDRLRYRVLAFCLVDGASCAALMDHDSDQTQDDDDNCPFTANPQQGDGGGVVSLVADGIGDACQCGELEGDAWIGSGDLGALRTHLAGGAAPPGLDRCSVHGDALCDVVDAAVLARAVQFLAPGILQVCGAATR